MRDVPNFLSAARNAPRVRGVRLCALAFLALALLLGSVPASADENASLSNVLLVEQLTDVATTQQFLHGSYCSRQFPVIAPGPMVIGTAHTCLQGSEADPLARPFVGSIAGNAAVAVVVNGMLRLALHAFGRAGTHAMRYGVVLYPAIMVGNVSQIFHLQGLSSSISLSIRRH
jgi:hypothetical protein